MLRRTPEFKEYAEIKAIPVLVKDRNSSARLRKNPDTGKVEYSSTPSQEWACLKYFSVVEEVALILNNHEILTRKYDWKVVEFYLGKTLVKVSSNGNFTIHFKTPYKTDYLVSVKCETWELPSILERWKKSFDRVKAINESFLEDTNTIPRPSKKETQK